LLSFLNF